MENLASQQEENQISGGGSAVEEVRDDCSQLCETDDANILSSLLPPNVWDLVGSKLKPSEMRVLSNSSPYFRAILLPKRTQFLFPDVLQPLSEELEKQEAEELEEKKSEEPEVLPEVKLAQQDAPEQMDVEPEKAKNVSNILKCRQVCKFWNKSIDKFIEETSQPSFFHVTLPSPNNRGLAHAKYTYFGDYSWKLNEFMAHFEQTHSSTRSLLSPPRNPFIGRLVVIHLPDELNYPNGNLRSVMHQAEKLLREYGQYIKVLNVRLPIWNNELQNHLWLLECLPLVPNLTHLKVCSFPMLDCDMQFGEHIFHPNLGRLPPDVREETERIVNRVGGYLQQIDFDQLTNRNPDQVPLVGMDVSPLPSLKCLKLCNVPAVTFNPLVQAYRHVEWLHVERPTHPEFHFRAKNYVDLRQVDFPNLNTFYIRLLSPAEVMQLFEINSSWWGNLTRVHLDYSWQAPFVDWRNLLVIIEASWRHSLIELKLRLPKSINFSQNVRTLQDATECRLNLPKLKRLKIWISKDSHPIPLFFLDRILEIPDIEFQEYDGLDEL